MQEEAAMHHPNRWLVVILIIAGLLLSACARTQAPASNPPPNTLEEIPGVKDIKRVKVTPKAAERTGIQTAPLQEEPVVRKRKIGAEIVAGSTVGLADPGRVGVRLFLSESELNKVDRSQPAQVLALASGRKPIATAQPVQGPSQEPRAAGDGGTVSTSSPTSALYYAVDGAGQRLVPGERVLVEVALAGNGQRKVVPYSAIVYDTKGGAWVYTSPEPLVYVRHPVTVSFFDVEETKLTTNDIYATTSIEDFLIAYGGRGRAVLLEGPPLGTQIVTVGAMELFGAETGIGK
jgi:hypothetical protein